MLEMFISPYKYRDKSKLEGHGWNSLVVDFCAFGVGWAVPTFDK
jgi:hypothetical protein